MAKQPAPAPAPAPAPGSGPARPKFQDKFDYQKIDDGRAITLNLVKKNGTAIGATFTAPIDSEAPDGIAAADAAVMAQAEAWAAKQPAPKPEKPAEKPAE